MNCFVIAAAFDCKNNNWFLSFCSRYFVAFMLADDSLLSSTDHTSGSLHGYSVEYFARHNPAPCSGMEYNVASEKYATIGWALSNRQWYLTTGKFLKDSPSVTWRCWQFFDLCSFLERARAFLQHLDLTVLDDEDWIIEGTLRLCTFTKWGSLKWQSLRKWCTFNVNIWCSWKWYWRRGCRASGSTIFLNFGYKYCKAIVFFSINASHVFHKICFIELPCSLSRNQSSISMQYSSLKIGMIMMFFLMENEQRNVWGRFIRYGSPTHLCRIFHVATQPTQYEPSGSIWPHFIVLKTIRYISTLDIFSYHYYD